MNHIITLLYLRPYLPCKVIYPPLPDAPTTFFVLHCNLTANDPKMWQGDPNRTRKKGNSDLIGYHHRRKDIKRFQRSTTDPQYLMYIQFKQIHSVPSPPLPSPDMKRRIQKLNRGAHLRASICRWGK